MTARIVSSRGRCAFARRHSDPGGKRMDAAQDIAMSDEDDAATGGRERRRYERFETAISVDYSSGDTFLFSYIQNISEMGIFIRSDDPFPIGTVLQLRFVPDGQ